MGTLWYCLITAMIAAYVVLRDDAFGRPFLNPVDEGRDGSFAEFRITKRVIGVSDSSI